MEHDRTLKELLADSLFARLAGSLESILWDQCRILADRLEELDYLAHAYGFRWLANEQRFPHRFLHRWYWAGVRKKQWTGTHYLPKPVLETMKIRRSRREHGWGSSPSLFESFWMAADAIAYSNVAPPELRLRCNRPPHQE